MSLPTPHLHKQAGRGNIMCLFVQRNSKDKSQILCASAAQVRDNDMTTTQVVDKVIEGLQDHLKKLLGMPIKKMPDIIQELRVYAKSVRDELCG